jgi:hypothetical protein
MNVRGCETRKLEDPSVHAGSELIAIFRTIAPGRVLSALTPAPRWTEALRQSKRGFAHPPAGAAVGRLVRGGFRSCIAYRRRGEPWEPTFSFWISCEYQ